MQLEDLPDRQRQYDHVSPDIQHSVRQPERGAIDTYSLDVLIPRPLNGQALKDRCERRCDSRTDNDRKRDVAQRSKSLRDEYAHVQQDGGRLVKTNHNLVWCLRHEEELETCP